MSDQERATATPAWQTLAGVMERFTFQNEENGYTVAQLTPHGQTYTVTVVGTLTGVAVGEAVRLRGFWTTHPTHGRQFEVREFQVQLPATVEGLRKYLGSGLIKGVGPVTAERIVDYFGLATLTVIEQTPERLREVPGIAEKRVALIRRAWAEQRQIKDLMLFLQAHGLSTSLAVKIYQAYGATALTVVQQDPYRLARDIYGIGFKTADQVAQQLGLSPEAPERLQAGVRYALSALSDEGHCFAEREQLLGAAAGLLQVAPERCAAALDALLAGGELLAEDAALYLPPFYHAERAVAAKLRLLQTTPLDRLAQFQRVEWPRAFAWLATQSALQLTEAQQAAVKMALTARVSIVTGGPGTGKTTVLGSVLRLLQAKGGTALLAAPTGRAAQRLSETTGWPAQTIHRLLEYRPTAGQTFLRDRDNPLDADLLIVDEVSMLDLLLTHHLLKAVAAGSHLLLVGDVDQLPAVGAGNVLRDLLASAVLPVVRLTTIFRQAADSAIIRNAHRIQAGEFPLTAAEIRDFFIFQEPDPDKAADLVLDLVAARIPARFGYAAETDIQVLSPMHRGAAGVGELNRRLQARLNPPQAGKATVPHGARQFRVGDRVLQMRNNYAKQVFNGDLGRVTAVDLEEQLLLVDFAGTPVAYEWSELDELTHAYAISIHKAQGSEFPVVVIPVLLQHYLLLQRNLLYTAVTRARQLVVLVGSRPAIALAVRNERIAQRHTRLAQRLQAAAGVPGGYPAGGRSQPGERRG